jgi:hypothetical protein
VLLTAAKQVAKWTLPSFVCRDNVGVANIMSRTAMVEARCARLQGYDVLSDTDELRAALGAAPAAAAAPDAAAAMAAAGASLPPLLQEGADEHTAAEEQHRAPQRLQQLPVPKGLGGSAGLAARPPRARGSVQCGVHAAAAALMAVQLAAASAAASSSAPLDVQHGSDAAPTPMECDAAAGGAAAPAPVGAGVFDHAVCVSSMQDGDDAAGDGAERLAMALHDTMAGDDDCADMMAAPTARHDAGVAGPQEQLLRGVDGFIQLQHVGAGGVGGALEHVRMSAAAAGHGDDDDLEQQQQQQQQQQPWPGGWLQLHM